jgi:hypothetical protein
MDPVPETDAERRQALLASVSLSESDRETTGLLSKSLLDYWGEFVLDSVKGKERAYSEHANVIEISDDDRVAPKGSSSSRCSKDSLVKKEIALRRKESLGLALTSGRQKLDEIPRPRTTPWNGVLPPPPSKEKVTGSWDCTVCTL